MQPDMVTQKIREFIVGNFPRARNIGNDENLLEKRILDSLGVLEVVAFLENEFQIAVSDDELLPENFLSIQCVAAFIEQRKGM